MYSTKEVMQKTGLTKDTVRYYEKMNIIGQVARDSNGYRLYSDQNIEWLEITKVLRSIGIPVAELIHARDKSLEERIGHLEAHELKIEKKIQELKAIQTQIEEKKKYIRHMMNQ